LPLGFFTITRLETQSEGVTTGFITPNFSSRCSSFFNFGLSAIGIRLNGDFTGGMDSAIFGRFRWLKMPFGISPAPEYFQQFREREIESLPGVRTVADDIIIYGKVDHDRKLKVFFDRVVKRTKINSCSERKKCHI
jgi:hypothetical protein